MTTSKSALFIAAAAFCLPCLVVPRHGGAQEDKGKVGVLALLPLGKVDDEAVETVRTSIGSYYGWKVTVLPAEELPQSAWYAPRKRYRAEIILAWLAGKIPEGADKIMGITMKDISTTKGKIKDWGICGLGDMPGVASVVSTFRLPKKMGKKLTAVERHLKYLKRLSDLAAHEFGHTLGLDHCPNTGCIMEDAKGTVTTFDHSTGKLCDECKAILKGWGIYVAP